MSRPSLASEVRAHLSELGERFRVGRRERLHKTRDAGLEYPDPTPVELPIGYEAPPTLRELMQKTIREEVSRQAAEVGLGTFDEENDFEPEDPEEIVLTGYEVVEYPFQEEPGSPLQDEEATPESPPAEPSDAVQASPGGPEGASQADPEGPSTEPAPGTAGDQ